MSKYLFLGVALGVIFSTLLFADTNETQIYKYKVEVQASTLKPNGKSWDISGGAPDMVLTVDNEIAYSQVNCHNRYRCTFEIFSKNVSWYFEVYDRDVVNHDIIGVGECSLAYEPCKIGKATIKVTLDEQ